jgi:hypothetical protein
MCWSRRRTRVVFAVRQRGAVRSRRSHPANVLSLKPVACNRAVGCALDFNQGSLVQPVPRMQNQISVPRLPYFYRNVFRNTNVNLRSGINLREQLLICIGNRPQ